MQEAPRSSPGACRFDGRCHCGNLEVSFATSRAPELVVRSCACSFCRRHGARCVSDPTGSVRILVHDPSLLIRYRFGLRTAEFLVCGRCGSYLGAVMTDGAPVATINANNLDPPLPFQGDGVPMDYGSEREPERRARRAAGWTPVVAFEAPPQRLANARPVCLNASARGTSAATTR
jgi:hypothetical protein